MDSQKATPPQMSPPVSDAPARTMSSEEAKQELHEAIQGSNEILAKATTTFTLFPDTMIVDRAKVTVTKRTFFRMAEVMSLRIEDILNSTCTVGPFLGNVRIFTRVPNPSEPSMTVGRFWRNDAKRLKRILQGYVIALQRDIDCSPLDTRELAKLLERLGADNHQGESANTT